MKTNSRFVLSHRQPLFPVRFFRPAVVALALLASTVSIARAASAAKKILVNSDAVESAEGFRPKAGKPIYYALKQVKVQLGESISNKLPTPDAVLSAVEAELKKQGFERTDANGPAPSVFITATWGDANFAPPSEAEIELEAPRVLEQQRAFASPASGGGGTGSTGTVVTHDEDRLRQAGMNAYLNSGRSKDRLEMDAIIGGDKVTKEDKDGAKILAAAAEDRFYITVAALDPVAASKKEKRVLWRTSMSIPTSNDFAKSLKPMLESGGSTFGVKSPKSVFVTVKS